MQKMLAMSSTRYILERFDGNVDKVYYLLCTLIERLSSRLTEDGRKDERRQGDPARAVEDERVVATFSIYFSRATGSKSNDHPGASRRRGEASWNRPSCSSRRKREKERGAALASLSTSVSEMKL